MDNFGLSIRLTVIALFVFSGLSSIQAADTVITANNTKLWAGSNGSLSCQPSGSPVMVIWFKTPNIQLVSWSPQSGIATQYPRFNISSEFSLLIANVTRTDEGVYSCIATYMDGSLTSHNVGNQTDVKVFDEADEPYPVINKCADNEDSYDQKENGGKDECILQVNNNTDFVNLTCSAGNFYPSDALELIWTRDGDNTPIEPIRVDLSNDSNTEPTYSISVTIRAIPSEEEYVCTVSGDVVRGDERSARVSVRSPGMTTKSPDVTDDPDKGAQSGGLETWIIIVIAVGGGVVFIGLVVALVFFRKRKNQRGGHKQVKYQKTDQKDEGIVKDGNADTGEEVDV